MGLSADEAPESKAFAATHHVPFPLLQDTAAEVAARYGVRMASQDIAIPSIFVIAPDGRITWRHVGEYVPDRPAPEAVLEALDGVAAPSGGWQPRARRRNQPKSDPAE